MGADCAYKRHGGFTLIELSIVLVVIGLIVGGVLVGQSLINAAAVRAQITQIEKYNTAVNTFREKYGGIPGDLTVNLANQFGFIVPTSGAGNRGCRDGNGLLDGGAGNETLAALMGENALFWMDLSQAGFVDITPLTGGSTWDSYTTVASGVCSFSTWATNPGTYIPPGKIGYGTYLHVYEVSGYNWFQLAKIAGFNSSGSIVQGSPTIPVIQAYSLDQKVDDGIPNTGRVQAVYINGSQSSTTLAPNAAIDNATTCYNTATMIAAYSITYNGGNGANCALSFRFQAGD
jgi:prepilin-type N-terminal cleavage/methylation domain-containing protein